MLPPGLDNKCLVLVSYEQFNLIIMFAKVTGNWFP